jgi:Domain of unknown function (DUF4279)
MKKTIISLRLMSESLKPEQLAVGMVATIDASWRKGERRGKTALPHAENGVEFRSLADGSGDIEDQLHLLMERIRPDAERIRGLGCDSVQLSIAVYDPSPPGYCLEPALIELLGYLGASIDIDQYLVDDD